MPNLASKATDQIFRRAVTVGSTISDELQQAILRGIVEADESILTTGETVEHLRRIIEDFGGIFADHFLATDLAGWLAGMDWTSTQLPAWVLQDFLDQPAWRNPPPPTTRFPGRFGEADEPSVRFPRLEQAAKRLSERKILTKDAWEAETQAARDRAFTLAGDLSTATIDTIRGVLTEDIAEGTSFEGFVRKLEQRIGKSPLAPGHLETVYRTNVQAAFRDGRETIMSQPVIAEVFPYAKYSAIDDSRVTPTHLALQTLGMMGAGGKRTGVYRRDDPFWDTFTPPWWYNCRCGTYPLTVARAASFGVLEAIEWHRTGVPPANPEWRYLDIPFQGNPGWGSRGRTGSLVV